MLVAASCPASVKIRPWPVSTAWRMPCLAYAQCRKAHTSSTLGVAIWHSVPIHQNVLKPKKPNVVGQIQVTFAGVESVVQTFGAVTAFNFFILRREGLCGHGGWQDASRLWIKEELCIDWHDWDFSTDSTHSDEMGDTALDTKTLCLFDVDGTLTAARQVLFVFACVCASDTTTTSSRYTLHSAPFIRTADVTSAQRNIRFHAVTYLSAASVARVSTPSKYMLRNWKETVCEAYLFVLCRPATMKWRTLLDILT